MDEHVIEPRKAMWARAEVSWADPLGTLCRAPATIEDTSPSGACVRLKTPIAVGSTLTVRWHLEQFSGVARNCRTDGKDFLLGIQRASNPPVTISRPTDKPEDSAELSWQDMQGTMHHAPARVESRTSTGATLVLHTPIPAGSTVQILWRGEHISGLVEHCHWKGSSYELAAQNLPAPEPVFEKKAQLDAEPKEKPAVDADTQVTEPTDSDEPVPQELAAGVTPVEEVAAVSTRVEPQLQPSQTVAERKVMEPKSRFPKFWRRQDETAAPETTSPAEAPMNKPPALPETTVSAPSELLSYEDIYRAAGIVGPASGYDVGKVIRMLESEHIRALSGEVKRASVLMALDAAGTSVEELLKDASQHQQALNHYEAGQQEKFEKFEAFKAQEETKVQAEMDRLVAHYGERIQQLHNHVAREKEALRNWQSAKQNESQRISEVIDLLSKQSSAPPAVVPPDQLAAAQGAPHPVLVSKASAAK